MNHLTTLCSTNRWQLPAIAKYVQHLPNIYISSDRPPRRGKNDPV